MEQQWVVKSLTIWGLLITTLSGLLPAVNGLLGIWWPDFALSPEWLEGLDTGVRALISASGMVIGTLMVLKDRMGSEVKKKLVLGPTPADKKKLGLS